MRKQSYQKKVQEISDIVKWRFDAIKNSLCLTNYSDQWIAVLQYKSWARLKQLHLTNCHINDDNVDFIINLRWSYLQILDLSGNCITFAGIKKLLQISWSDLHIFIIKKLKQNERNSHNEIINCKLAEQNFQIKNLAPQLLRNDISMMTQLTLSDYSLGSAGIKLLSKINLPVLERLSLQHSQIGEEGMKMLTKSKWPALKLIDLRNNYTNCNGFAHINSYSWKKLSMIQIGQYNQKWSMVSNESVWLLNLVIFETKHCDIVAEISNRKLKMTKGQILRRRFLDKEIQK